MFNDKFCLTKAVLDGTKTMTRRILKEGTPLGAWKETKKHLPYKVGDVLAIAQSYNDIYNELEAQGNWVSNEWWIKASDSVGGGLDTSAGYKNKMFVRADFMIHHIKFINVRLERLQDISDEECLREGLKFRYVNMNFGNTLTREDYYYTYLDRYGEIDYYGTASPKKTFSIFIDKICGYDTWESNPWVAAYSLELVD